nr:MAG: hypothetical protein [Microviridae sp.]
MLHTNNQKNTFICNMKQIELIAGDNKVINCDGKKVQLSIGMLKELARDENLLNAYVEIICGEEEIKTPMAYAMAKREVKQIKIKL